MKYLLAVVVVLVLTLQYTQAKTIKELKAQAKGKATDMKNVLKRIINLVAREEGSCEDEYEEYTTTATLIAFVCGSDSEDSTEEDVAECEAYFNGLGLSRDGLVENLCKTCEETFGAFSMQELIAYICEDEAECEAYFNDFNHTQLIEELCGYDSGNGDETCEEMFDAFSMEQLIAYMCDESDTGCEDYFNDFSHDELVADLCSYDYYDSGNGDDAVKRVARNKESLHAAVKRVASDKESLRAAVKRVASDKESLHGKRVASNKESLRAAVKRVAKNKESLHGKRVASNKESLRAAVKRVASDKESLRAAVKRVARNKESFRAAVKRVARNKESFRPAGKRVASDKESLRELAVLLLRTLEKK